MAVSDHDLQLPPARASVGEARRYVAARLAELDAAPVTEVATLLTSELVTNAIVHAGGCVRLRVSVDGSTVRVTVEDPSQERPRVRRTTSDAVTGRGLALVAAMSDRWGVDDLDDGKAVWFELQL